MPPRARGDGLGSPAPLSPALRQRLAYRKLASPPYTILLFDSGYHLQGELVAAAAAQGHRVVRLAVGAGGAASAPAAMRSVLAALVAHRPDLVVSINHIGFDAEGAIGGLLEACRLPVAVWYVDCPFFIHDGYFAAAPSMTIFFTWERAFAPLLARLSGRPVHFLPLACQPARLGGPAPAAAGATALFVGGSATSHRARWRRDLDADAGGRARAMAGRLEAGEPLLPHLEGVRPTPDAAMTEMAEASFLASGWRRLRHLRGLEGEVLAVAGDRGWRRDLPWARHLGEVRYGADLGALYRAAQITINVTSVQMPTAVNQRAFDVPAAGGFVLSDRQADLEELFDRDSVATYADPESLAAELRFFAARPALRATTARRARQRVLAAHTYEHRLAALLSMMRAASKAG